MIFLLLEESVVEFEFGICVEAESDSVFFPPVILAVFLVLMLGRSVAQLAQAQHNFTQVTQRNTTQVNHLGNR